MNPKTLAALAVIPVLLHLHLSVAVAGTAVTVFVPWTIVAVLAGTSAVLVALIVRNLRGFRSRPYPRTVFS